MHGRDGKRSIADWSLKLADEPVHTDEHKDRERDQSCNHGNPLLERLAVNGVMPSSRCEHWITIESVTPAK